jgi:hypothetical protein
MLDLLFVDYDYHLPHTVHAMRHPSHRHPRLGLSFHREPFQLQIQGETNFLFSLV